MIGIINYKAGNLFSLQNSLKKISAKFTLISDPNKIKDYSKIILPGVGNANFAMQELQKFVPAIQEYEKPLLGICLGMQLMAEYSEEGNTNCLNIIPNSKVVKFSDTLKVPQIGWNKINIIKKSQLLKDIKQEEYFYFVNSFYMPTSKNTVARSIYGTEFSAIMEYQNFYGVQFHPEKSNQAGLQLLSNFANI
jgi:glutamine amidotransferase